MSEMINPYIAGAPVTERTMFFGRQDVFDWVQRSLTGKFVDHTLVIHGQRRVGKTSVLKQIPFHLPPTYIPVFFDLQGRSHTTIDGFLWRLAKEITRTLRITQDISLPEPSREDFARDPEFFQNRFLPQLGQGIGDRHLLLLFDEFDLLAEPTAREVLATDLIPYFSRLMQAPGPLCFIFSIGSSGRKLEHMQASYTDFFRSALYNEISFLEKEEAFRLITQPVVGVIEYELQAVEEIFQITSGHPYFTQLVCHELFGYCQKSGKRRIASEDIEAVLDDVVERGSVNLKFMWDDASDREKYVLTALSLAEDGRNTRAIHQFLQGQKVRISEREVADSLRNLQQKDVLTSDNSFTVDLMRLWLLENKPLERVIEELMEVSPIARRFIEIAQEFHETGNLDKALENYGNALEVDPHNLIAQVAIASVRFERGELGQAAQEYQKALDIDPEYIPARSGFCQTHLALGDQLMEGQIEEGLEQYRQVLSINEQHLEARERLAAHHAHQGTQLREQERFDEAIEAFETALEFTPDDRVISAQLADAEAAKRAKGLATLREIGEEHFGAERWAQAIASFEEYLSLEAVDEESIRAVDGRLAEAREQRELAELYRQAQAELDEKRYGQAASLLQEIIDRDMSYKDALRLLAKSVELQRGAKPLWKDTRVLAGAGGFIAVIIIAFLVIRLPSSLIPAGIGLVETPSIAASPVLSDTATLMSTQIVATATPRLPAPTPTFTPIPLMRTLEGHQGSVQSVAFSPNGTMLASGSTDETVILWDLVRGQPVLTLRGHTTGVLSVCFSPDGATLASGGGEPRDSRLILWDVESGQQLRILRGLWYVYSVAFSTDGTTLACGSSGASLSLWRVSDGTLLGTTMLEGHPGALESMALFPDGRTLASGSDDGRVSLWDVQTGQRLRSFVGHTDKVLDVALSPDGMTLASGSWDHTVRLWRVSDASLLGILQGHSGRVHGVAFSPDGRILASGSEDTTVMMWDVESGQRLRTLEGHTGQINSVAFSPDGATLASGSMDKTVILWHVEAAIATPISTVSAPSPTSTRQSDIPTPVPAAPGMALIAAGEFIMGSSDSDTGAEAVEYPQRTVYVDAFYIDIHEVTNAQYRDCAEAGACQPPASTSSPTRTSYYGNPEYDNYPVIKVTWHDALTYCQWAGKRLPTEAEWEKAARSTDGRIYPWGDEWDGSKVNYCDARCSPYGRDEAFDDGYEETAPVGAYSPQGDSLYGVADMAGNAWEWTSSLYRDYPYDPDDGREDLGAAGFRVLRGGSWDNYPDYARCAFRYWHTPHYRNDDVGFRCARSSQE